MHTVAIFGTFDIEDGSSSFRKFSIKLERKGGGGGGGTNWKFKRISFIRESQAKVARIPIARLIS